MTYALIMRRGRNADPERQVDFEEEPSRTEIRSAATDWAYGLASTDEPRSVQVWYCLLDDDGIEVDHARIEVELIA